MYFLLRKHYLMLARTENDTKCDTTVSAWTMDMFVGHVRVQIDENYRDYRITNYKMSQKLFKNIGTQIDDQPKETRGPCSQQAYER